MVASRPLPAGREGSVYDEQLSRTVWHCVITTPLMYVLFFNREKMGAWAAKKRAEYGYGVFDSGVVVLRDERYFNTPFGSFGFDGPWSTALAVQFAISLIVGGMRTRRASEPATLKPATKQSSVWLLRAVVIMDTYLASLNSITVKEYSTRFASKECGGFATLSECIRRRYFPSTHMSFLSKWLFSGLPVRLVIFPEFIRNFIFVILSIRLLADEARATGEPIPAWPAAAIVLEACFCFLCVTFGVALMRPGAVRGELFHVDNCPTPWLRRWRDRLEAALLAAAARRPATCQFVGACFSPGLTPVVAAVSIGMGFHSLHEMGYSINAFLLFVLFQQFFTVINSVSAGFYVSSAFGVANRKEIFDRMLGRGPALDVPGGVTHLWMVDKSELQLEDVIGSGSFSTVWRAQWRGTPVAVKVWHVMDKSAAWSGQPAAGSSDAQSSVPGKLARSLGPLASVLHAHGLQLSDEAREAREARGPPGAAPGAWEDGSGGAAAYPRDPRNPRDAAGDPGAAGLRLLSSESDPSVHGWGAIAGAAAWRDRLASSTLASSSGGSAASVGAGGAGDRMGTFSREVELLLRLRHPNILAVFAVVEEPPMLVMALGARGTLHDVLVASTLETLPWQQRVAVLRGVTCGLVFLHTQAPPIYHMDLKARNVVMSSAMEPQLADFGLSGPLLSGGSAQAHPAPPKNAYAAPEVLMGEPIDGAAVDAYGFGCVLNNTIVVGTGLAAPGSLWARWETGTSASWDAVQVAFKRMENGFCVELVPGSPPPLAALLARCCARDPGARPAMVDVLKELRRIELAGCDSWWNPRARRGV